jgi:peptide/nickel transport system substrate-binding protein
MKRYKGRNVQFGKRHLAITILAVVVVAAILGGCGTASSSSGSSSGDPAANQPTLRIGMLSGFIQTLNPFLATTSSDQAAYTYQYPMLVQCSTDLVNEPGLAKSWSTSADGKTWTFDLVSGAKWSDGQPITASDAAFTINTVVRLADGVGGNISVYTPGIKKATAPDPQTLVITLSAPQSALLGNMNGLPILPEHVWAPLAEGNGNKIKTFTGDPKDGPVVVSGPFVVAQFDSKGTTIFKRVDTYYGPQPKVTEWGWQYFSDPDAAIQGLKNDQIDVAAGLPATAMDALKSSASIKMEGFGQGQLGADFLYTKGTERHPELRVPQVREAFNAAIDRQAIVDSAFRGFATAGGSMFLPQWSPTYYSPVPVPAYDAAKANEILDGLGFKKGSDGVRTANGVKMSYKLVGITSREGTYGRAADAVRLNLEAIGVDFQVVWVDDALSAVLGPKGDYENGYDGYFGGILFSPDPDWSLMEFTTQMIGAYNLFGYSNPEVDKLYAEQSAATTPETRKAAFEQAVGILQKDQVEVGVCYQQAIVGWNSQWQNIGDLGYMNGWMSLFSQDGFANIYHQ